MKFKFHSKKAGIVAATILLIFGYIEKDQIGFINYLIIFVSTSYYLFYIISTHKSRSLIFSALLLCFVLSSGLITLANYYDYRHSLTRGPLSLGLTFSVSFIIIPPITLSIISSALIYQYSEKRNNKQTQLQSQQKRSLGNSSQKIE